MTWASRVGGHEVHASYMVVVPYPRKLAPRHAGGSRFHDARYAL